MMRAAPAKKRSWSAPAATSSEAIRERTWPVLRCWASTSSSLLASTASASLSSMSWRCPGVVCFQVLKAFLAAVMAASTSACTEIGDCATTSPLVGFTMGSNPVPAGVTNSPLMKFCKV